MHTLVGKRIRQRRLELRFSLALRFSLFESLRNMSVPIERINNGYDCAHLRYMLNWIASKNGVMATRGGWYIIESVVIRVIYQCNQIERIRPSFVPSYSINGLQVDTRSNNTVEWPAGVPFLGLNAAASQWLDGVVEEMLIFSKKLTAAQRAKVLDYMRKL